MDSPRDPREPIPALLAATVEPLCDPGDAEAFGAPYDRYGGARLPHRRGRGGLAGRGGDHDACTLEPSAACSLLDLRGSGRRHGEAQYDAWTWFDRTRAVQAHADRHGRGVPETWPFGV